MTIFLNKKSSDTTEQEYTIKFLIVYIALVINSIKKIALLSILIRKFENFHTLKFF